MQAVISAILFHKQYQHIIIIYYFVNFAFGIITYRLFILWFIPSVLSSGSFIWMEGFFIIIFLTVSVLSEPLWYILAMELKYFPCFPDTVNSGIEKENEYLNKLYTCEDLQSWISSPSIHPFSKLSFCTV